MFSLSARSIRGMLVVSLASLSAFVLVACATTGGRSISPWGASSGKGGTEVVFRDRGQALVLRKGSGYGRYRELRRSEFLAHKVPVEASSAYLGRQGRYNYDVFYVMEEDRGRAIYGFTYGKFDIEWPPYLFYRVDRAGKVSRFKELP